MGDIYITCSLVLRHSRERSMIDKVDKINIY